MAQVEILARQMVFQIKGEGESFLEIENIDNVGHSPTTTRADTGTFKTAGRARSLPAERGDSFTLTIKKTIDPETGKEPPGNEALRELSKKVGFEGIGTFRYLGPSGHGIEFEGDAEVGYGAGGRNDPASYSVTITVTGDINPVTPTP